MSIVWNLLLFILILGAIVAIHEFGHFIFAKLMGVYVYEYAIGMGPKLFSFKPKNSETVYSIRAVPLGGFCSLAGEDTEFDDGEKVPKEKRLQAKKPWQRFLIMFMGPGFNFLLTIVVIFFVSLFTNSYTTTPVMRNLKANTPAVEAGIENGDKILKINGHNTYTYDDVQLFVALSDKTKKTTIVVEKKDGSTKTYKVLPKKEKNGKKTRYVYGITSQGKKTTGIINATKYTFIKTGAFFRQMFVTLGALFTGGVSVKDLSGPVGIFSIVGEYAKSGIASLFFLMAFLSLNVGFLNLLPLPAFDGGHILFILIELIRRKPVNPKVENIIHTVGLCLLLLLMVYVTINDIFRLF
jgi:regulator of sigma E protease